jgi:23S rRNA (uracil1939-C5)-methyltransferase
MKQGVPDLVVLDPPRAGLHKKVVEVLNNLEIPRIIYVSCNPATQARDIEMMKEAYNVLRIQPLDMFPQTHHVENILEMQRRG